MQVLGKEFTAADRYVADREWERAILCECPFHPQGGCGLRKLGTYRRVEPEGTRVARYWCPREGVSISLLPALIAARMRGTLDAIEVAVLAVEQTGSIAAAAERMHPAIKRVREVHRAVVSDEVVLAESTVHRLLARRGLMRKTNEPTTKDHRRFEYESAGEFACCLGSQVVNVVYQHGSASRRPKLQAA